MTDVREQLQRAQAGDKEARNYLVQENIGLVKHIVSRYTARGVEKEDLFQCGKRGSDPNRDDRSDKSNRQF